MPKKLPAPPRRNAPWTPLQRRAWLAGQRRKHPLLPAPVLRAQYPDKLVWDWTWPNPYKWNVWQSLNGGASYFLANGYWMYGDARLFAPDGAGELHFIVGVNETGREVTHRSNAVRPEDALVPVITLSSDGHGRLTWTCNVASEFGFTIGHSPDNATWNDYYDGADGSETGKNDNGDPGWFRIARLDGDGFVLLPYSNVVYSDGL